MKGRFPIIPLILLCGLFSCQNKAEDYLKIPDEYDNEQELVKGIHPNTQYEYWEYRHVDSNLKHNVLRKQGTNKHTQLEESLASGGFFEACHPLICYSYIIAERSGQVEWYATATGLREFIGRVDNLQEALLIVKTHSYSWQNSNQSISTYRTNPDSIEMVLVWPSAEAGKVSKRYVRVNRNGEFFTRDIGVQKKD